MYISVKLPPAFGSFNKLRKENYPFNNLFTSYLAAVSRLGLELQMDVPELVGYIEDRVFDGQRLPDVPEGDEAVNFRYKTEDPDVVKYIGESSETNRMAVMYIARMTLRLSAAYGTSLFRLTRLINDMDPQAEAVKAPKKAKTKPVERPAEIETPPKKAKEQKPKEEAVETIPALRVSSKSAEQEPAIPPVQETRTASALASAEAARAALSQLAGLTAQAVEEETEEDVSDMSNDVVETNPYLNDFL